MTKLIATLCTALALLVALPRGGAAQLQPLRADDPAARFVAGLIEPMLAGDEAAAAAYLLRHAAPEANRDSLELRLGEVLATIRSQEAPRIETFFRGGPGGTDVMAALTSATGHRLLVGTRMSEDRSAIMRLIATPAWAMTFLPTPPEPAIPGLLEIPETPATLAFVNVAVVPMDEERVLRDQTVLVRDGRIVQMGGSRSVRVPRGAYLIDGAGKYLMPGLVEMHTHLPWPQEGEGALERTLFLFLAHGVTTVRGMLPHPSHLELRARAAGGEHLSPRIITAGPRFEGPLVSSPEEAARQVEAQHAAGYDFLKLPYGEDRATFEAIVAAAQRVGMPVAGHVWSEVGLEGALAAGQQIEHLDAYLPALAGFGAGFTHEEAGYFGMNMVDRAEEARMAELGAATRDAGVWNVPTLSWLQHMFSEYSPEEMASRPELRYLPAGWVSNWSAYTRARRAEPVATPERRARYLELRRRLVLELHRAGAGLLLGSDAPQLWNVPGASIQRELQMMVDAGLTPYQALETGTRNPALFFGTDEWGTVAPGKVADLIVLEANPLDDIANLARRAGVMVRGTWLPEAEIQVRLATIEAALGAA